MYFGSWTIWHVIEFLFHGNGVKESCNFENLLHAKWSNFASTQKKSTKFSGMLGEDEKMIREKFFVIFFIERPSKLKKVNSQDLVKQTVLETRVD